LGSPRYLLFEHTADLGIEIFGKEPRELMENAVFALFDLMTEREAVRPEKTWEVAVEGTSWDDLLVNLLREVLFLANGQGILFREFSVVDLGEYRLTGRGTGERFDPRRHRMEMEIKAVTYHGLEVVPMESGWKGRVICDV